ncbi:MAG: enoyl-CoA hydratase/isomerase family protein [Alphaproteobacteria bacterium]|nr:enoyl-CoA hydratase/isomerase family protein [Alphaproteobacteria bacterium]
MTAVNAVVDLTLEGGIAVVTVDSPPVNALSAAVRTGLAEAIAQADADPAARAIVLICAGRTFIAGADITELGKPPQGVILPDVHRALEAARKPVIAAMHGTALGGGFETALACHARVAVPSARFGLPEIKLGIIPGAGGTVRLPRLVGAAKALELILSGAQFGAREALDWGVLDALVEEGALRAGALDFARRVVDESRTLRRVRDIEDRIAPDRGRTDLYDAVRKENARKSRGMNSPEAAIVAVQQAVELPFDEALRLARESFVALSTATEARALRHVFFAERQVAKIPDVPETTPALPIARIGIVGAGTMGGGIAMNFLNAGMPVTIVEVDAGALERGLAVVRRNYEGTVKRGRLTAEEMQARLSRLTGALDLAALADCDLVIEAAFENMDVKQDIFGRLDRIAKPGAILATNTSYLDVDVIAASTSRPESVCGMHFFSPANVMRLVEVVRGAKTARPVIATVMQLARRIGKIAVLVGVCHGFVGNRMLAQRQREANNLILEGAMPWDVDRVLYRFGLPMGPFAMADLAGLDLGWRREASTSSTMKEVLCEMGRRGQKTGAGFYDYDAERTPRPSPVVEQAIRDLAARKGIPQRAMSDQEILERCLYPMINEGARILEEGKALRASDIDVVWIAGYGWPAYRGGPMFWAETIGLGTVLARLRELQATLGDDFKPSALLERLVAEGKGFAAA